MQLKIVIHLVISSVWIPDSDVRPTHGDIPPPSNVVNTILHPLLVKKGHQRSVFISTHLNHQTWLTFNHHVMRCYISTWKHSHMNKAWKMWKVSWIPLRWPGLMKIRHKTAQVKKRSMTVEEKMSVVVERAVKWKDEEEEWNMLQEVSLKTREEDKRETFRLEN